MSDEMNSESTPDAIREALADVTIRQRASGLPDYFEDELEGIRGVVAAALPDDIGGTLLRWPAETWKDGRARIPASVVAGIVDPIVAALAPAAKAVQ